MSVVAGPKPDRSSKARSRLGAAVGASLLAHAVVLTLIGLNVPRPIYRLPPPIQATDVWIMPRLTALAHTPAEHKPAKTAARSTSPSAAPKVAPARPRPASPTPAGRAAPAPAPSGLAPAGAAKPAAGPQAADSGGGVREALRTSVGCDAEHIVHLSNYERDRCNQRVGEVARTQAPFSGIDPIKRGRFDDQAAADERRRANRTGPVQELVVPCTGQGSNLGGGCLPDSAIMHIQQH